MGRRSWKLEKSGNEGGDTKHEQENKNACSHCGR